MSGSISDPEKTAREVLAGCLKGERCPPHVVRGLMEADGGRALVGIVIEGLSDRFEPRLVDAYAALFSEVIAAVLPGYTAKDLLARYERVREPRRVRTKPEQVVVLSRVTLGADVAVTSVLLDAAKRRFPQARITLAGGAKSFELFAGDPRISHLPVSYGRCASLAERLAACPQLPSENTIVLDPDSRLSQLGLLPVCPEENYFFFESRSYGAESDEPLGCLARRWAAQTLGIAGARAYLGPAVEAEAPGEPFITVSLGVGENSAKRVPDPFEERLIAALVERGETLVVDTGAGGEEAERVHRAVERSRARPGQVRMFEGSFAAFASLIARSRFYIGYDSAGQHVAAACGVPLAAVFAGFPCDRFLARWHPAGPGRIEVIRHEGPGFDTTLARVLAAVP